MNAIEVKGTRGPAAETDPSETYVLKSTEKQAKTKTPHLVGMILMSVAVYLKSIFDSSSRTHDEPWSPKEPEEQPLAGPGIDEMATSTPGLPQDLPHNAPAEDGVGPAAMSSGGRLIRLQEPMEFMLVDSPGFDFSAFVTGGVGSSRPVPTPLRGAPANDNDSGAPIFQAPSGPTGPDIDWPADPHEPDDPENPEPDAPDAQEPDTQEPDDTEDEEDPGHQNRAPRVTGSVYLMDVTGCAVLAIALSDLLRNATDPDGDALSVKDITVSSGTLIQSGDGWLYAPGPQFYGPVTISYLVTDGELSVTQSAHFDVVRTVRIDGTEGDDTITGTACADEINALGGNDMIDAREGDDIVHGGDGDDRITGGDGNDVIFGGAGDDVIYGGSGKDLISGGFGNDQLFGDDDDDVLFGDEGDDILHGGDGSDMLAAGPGDDQLFGEAGNDRLLGDDGDDFLSGGDGADFLDGGAGNDTLDGGDGDDVLSDGAGSDIVAGGNGNDTVIAAADGADDQFDGGSGTDTLDYSADTDGVAVDLETGTASGAAIGDDTLESFEAVVGGAGNDAILGSSADEVLDGGDGDDVLSDGAGSDIVMGGTGDDTVIAAADGADDQFDGGEGCDTLDYSADTCGVTVDLESGTASGAAIGDDTVESFEAVVGGAGDDAILGSSADEVLDGGDGDDVLSDGAGSDIVMGGAGDDTVIAAADGADDILAGGEGYDTLDYSSTKDGVCIDTVAGEASGSEIGSDTISGFETCVGGSGDDHFIAGDSPTVMTGGDGDDTFEFVAPESTSSTGSAPTSVVHAIVDFQPGDIARMSKWDIFEETIDTLEDDLEKIYGEDIDADEVPIRFRYEQYEGVEKTIIEADLDSDGNYETTVLVDGHRAIVITEHC